MKILCPIDFSSAANNGIEYAARLAQRTNSSLMLLNVQRMYLHEGVSLFAGAEIDSVHEAKTTSHSLEEICNDIKKVFNVTCEFEIIQTLSSYDAVISKEADNYNLTVIGTNGADSAFEFYFGSNSFRVAMNTQSPVLIIPDGSPYKDIDSVVFASDYNSGDELHLKQLKDFFKIYNPHINVMHVSKKDTDVGKQIYRSFCDTIEETFDFDHKIHFKRIISNDAAEAIEKFTNETNSDLLAISFQPHSLLYRLFHDNLIRKITSHAFFPVLISHN